MADVDNTIALQTQTPNLMNTMGNMLNVANSAQQLKSGQQQLQTNQMILNERKGVQQVLQDPAKYADKDGNPDYNRMIADIMKVAPTTGPEYVTKVIQTHQASTTAKSALNTLNAQQREQVGQFVMTLGSDDPATAKRKLDAYVSVNPQLKPYADFTWNHLLAPTANDPAAFKQNAFKAATMKAAQGTMPVGSQAAAITPNYMNTGGKLVQTSPMAEASGAPSEMPVTMSPGNLETIETDAVGNKHVVSRSPQGAILSTRSMPGSGSPGESSNKSWTNLSPGQAQDIQAAQQETHTIRQAGDQAPMQRNINQQILQLSRDTTTGPGTQYWQKGLATIGLGQMGDNYQELGKFLEKNAIQAMQTMGGPPSDARLSAAAAANGSTQFNPGALQTVTKFNDAATSALDKYRQGVDKAVGVKNSDYTALPEFKANWSKNLDIDVFRVENAMRDGDTMELQKIAQELGPKRMKERAQKRRNLESLATTGKLP